MAGQRGRHAVPAADLKIADGRHAHGAGQQQYGLNALRPHDGQQAAHQRVQTGQHAQHDDEEHVALRPSTVACGAMPKMPRSTQAAVYSAIPIWMTMAEISEIWPASRGRGG